jgi:hypothetical protein
MMLAEINHFNRRKDEKQSFIPVTADDCNEPMAFIISIILKMICH